MESLPLHPNLFQQLQDKLTRKNKVVVELMEAWVPHDTRDQLFDFVRSSIC